MQKEVIELEVKTGKSEANIQGVTDSVKDLNKEVVKTNDRTEKGLKGVEKASKFTSKGIKAIGASLKALGIGLVIAAVAKFTQVLTQNQKISDGIATVMETVSIVFNKVVEAVTNANGEFGALGKVLGGILTLSITPIKLSFFAIKIALQQAQLAWEDSFFGGKDQDKIKQLRADIILTKQDIYEVGENAINAGKDIVNNFSDAVDSVSNISVKAAYEQAQVNIQLEKNAKLAAVANQGLIEQYDREAELLRQIRDDSSKSIAERIKANEDLGAVLDKQQKAMQANADSIVAAAQAQFNKNKNDENSIILQEALNEQAAIDAQITGFRSEQQTNLNSLLQEQKDLRNEIQLIGKTEVETAKIEAEQKLQTQIDLINREVENEQERNALLLEAKRVYNEEIAAIDAEVKTKEEEVRQADLKAKQEVAQKEIELEKQKTQQKFESLDAVISIADQESGLGKAAFLAKQLLQAKEMLMEAKGTLFTAKQTVTKATLKGAEATADTAAGAAKTAAAVPFPANIPLIVGYAAQAIGIIGAVKSAIGAAKSAAGGAGASGGGTQIQAPQLPTAAAPSFNVVGQGGTNQLAESIGSQTKEPTRAYVVASDVSTAQSMERNIISGASI